MIDKADKILLLENPVFRRFLFALIQSSGIFETTANGSDGRNLFLEGRRSLGLEVLRQLEEAQPAQSTSGIPVLTLIQTLREAVQTPPRLETRRGRKDAYAELRPEGETE